MTKRVWLDLFYLFSLDVIMGYIYFMYLMIRLDVINLSSVPYILLVIVISKLSIKIKLNLKKNNVNTLPCYFFSIMTICMLYIFLFNYYDYDYMNEKNVWLFGMIAIFFAIGEAYYYFNTYEKQKEAYEIFEFNFFKNKERHDEPHTK